jgi:iron complex transport system ATP-binding protein
MINAYKISYRLKQRDILNNIDLDIQKGELVAIVGPNGAGKTTLLSILSNEIKSDEPVFFKNKAYNNWSKNDLPKHKAKFSQHNNTDIPLLVEEIVIMGRYPYFEATPKKEDLEAASQAMKELDVFHLKNRLYNTLSGGEKQRVQLARVICQLTNHVVNKTLFLDEPLNNLDVLHQYRLLIFAQKYVENGNTIIMVVHDLNLASQFATKVIMLKNGEISKIGHPNEVFTGKNISQVYDFPCTICANPINKKPLIIFGN